MFLCLVEGRSSLLGETSRTMIYEGGCPRRLQACWWLTRPMRDRQARLHCSLTVIDAPWIFLLWHFSLRLAKRESSKVETTWWMVRRQVWRSAARNIFFLPELVSFFSINCLIDLNSQWQTDISSSDHGAICIKLDLVESERSSAWMKCTRNHHSRVIT